MSFQRKNPDFLLKTVDFLLKNVDFSTQNRPKRRAEGEHQPGGAVLAAQSDRSGRRVSRRGAEGQVGTQAIPHFKHKIIIFNTKSIGFSTKSLPQSVFSGVSD